MTLPTAGAPYPSRVAKLAIMIEGQEGVDWRLWKRLAETVEGLGFDSFWRSDHLYSVMGKFDRATIECWASLALIATWTKRIPFGPNVSPMTFREPGVLARTAAAVDVLSDGRLVMGVGAGWYEAEHRDFGITFPPLKERMDRMDASFNIMRGVWEARNPRPVRGTIPFLVGGDGERRTLRAVAEHADWWNTVMRPVPVLRHKLDVLQQHCREVGRDYASVRKTITRTAFLAPTREAAERKAGSRLEEPTPPFAGEPAALVDHLLELNDLGFDLFQMVFGDFPDTTDIRLFVDKVLPRL